MEFKRPVITVSRKSIEGLLKNGSYSFFSTGNKPVNVGLFAVLGGSHTGFSLPSDRGKTIGSQIQTLRRKPPVFGLIVKHDISPFHLPRFFHGYRTKQGKITTFDFLPKSSHAARISRYDTLVQTISGSLGHLALIEDGVGNAYLAQLQGNVSRHNLAGKGKKLLHEYERMYDFKLKRYYANAYMALFLAARRYCVENNLKLHIFHPNVYVGVTALKVPHLVEGNEAEIENLYGTTRGLARRLFKAARQEETSLPSKHWRAFVMPEIKDTLVIPPRGGRKKRS